MFGEKGTREGGAVGSGPISGLIEKGCEFEGKLTFEGTVRINGKFSGDIFSDGTLIIGEGATISGGSLVASISIAISGNAISSAAGSFEVPMAVQPGTPPTSAEITASNTTTTAPRSITSAEITG